MALLQLCVCPGNRADTAAVRPRGAADGGKLLPRTVQPLPELILHIGENRKILFHVAPPYLLPNCTDTVWIS
ncbi:hypothetical protein D3C76_1164220 [compost metagenome]